MDELVEATRIVSSRRNGQALIDIQLDIWYAKQRQLDNSENCAKVEDEDGL